jgi:hypothetical protein
MLYMPMNPSQRSLWRRIKAFELDVAGARFTFTDRLARENGWSISYAIRCVEEYKKFIFLICIADQGLTPSDQVDQVWHLHLIYTRSYWDDFCRNTLGKEIHHGPTKGGDSERNRFNNLYEASNAWYRKTFDKEPPEDIWPATELRFKEIHFTRVNRHRYWLVPKNPFKNP